MHMHKVTNFQMIITQVPNKSLRSNQAVHYSMHSYTQQRDHESNYYCLIHMMDAPPPIQIYVTAALLA
jgi:hypothetical protein